MNWLILADFYHFAIAGGAGGQSSFCSYAMFAQFKVEVSNAIVDNAVGGHLPPYYIPETRPAKPQAS
jgi:hypothetical protein